MNAKQTAKDLIKHNFPIEEYEELQNKRRERLLFWKNNELSELIEREKELIEYGEEVLSLLKANDEMN